MTIDDFENGCVGMAVDDNIDYTHPIAASLSPLPGVIGGQRDAALDFVAGPEYARVHIDRRDSGVLSFPEAPDTSAAATRVYGLNNDRHADLTGGGANNALRFVFHTADLAGNLTIGSFANPSLGRSTWTGPTASGLSSIDTNFNVAFNDRAWVRLDFGAPWTHVDMIAIRLAGLSNGDYVIKGIMAIPEPMALSLLAVGGLFVRRRRR